MVAFDRDNGNASEAAMKYFVLGALASGMRPDQREQLAHARKALRAVDWERELERWLRAVAITSDRTGFVVSGGLEASTHVVAGLRGGPPGITPAARVLELVRYSVSDEHADLRRHLCGRV